MELTYKIDNNVNDLIRMQTRDAGTLVHYLKISSPYIFQPLDRKYSTIHIPISNEIKQAK